MTSSLRRYKLQKKPLLSFCSYEDIVGRAHPEVHVETIVREMIK